MSVSASGQDEILKFSSENQKLVLQPVLKTKDVIWAFKFLPDQRIIFTEREGRIKIFDPKTKKISDVSGVPKVDARGQGGLLDVALHPQFSKNNRIYFSYSLAENGKNTTALATAILKDLSLTELKTIFIAKPFYKSTHHFGSRIVFDDQGFLFLSVGERNERKLSQDLGTNTGKVIRLKDDGAVPEDNPFVGKAKALPENWVNGLRNPQGMVWSSERKQLFVSDHGPRGGDEINIIVKGKNYGWPIITYGKEYWGPGIGEKSKEGLEQGIKYYVPSIAPSNISFYTGSKFKAWKGNLFVGALAMTHLNRLVLDGDKVVREEKLLQEWGQRIRDVQQGPDEFIYVATDGGDLARIVPQ